MASKKSYDERIEELKRKQEQLKAQEKALKKKQSAEEFIANTSNEDCDNITVKINVQIIFFIAGLLFTIA